MRYRWTNGLWTMAFIGCTTFSGDNTSENPNASNPPTSEDAGLGDGGKLTAPPCGNTVCDTPPKATCVDDRSYTSFTAACVEGACQYTPQPVPCPESIACVEGACVDIRARLSNLEVSPGTLSFDPEKMQYTVTVPADTPSVQIKASVADAKHSSISIDGGAKGSTSTVTSSATFAANSKTRQVPVRVDTTYGTSETYSVLFLYAGEQASLISSVATLGFGRSVGMSSDGSTLVVGLDKKFNSTTGFGTVFRRSLSGLWTEVATVTPIPNVGEDRFGESVFTSGDGKLLAVGASCDSSSSIGVNGPETTTSTLGCSGSVRIFKSTSDGTWKQEAFLKSSTPLQGANFGSSIAFSRDGTTLVVGASSEKGGAAYVFRRTPNGTWTEESKLDARFPDENGHFGFAVALSDTGIIAVGAPYERNSSRGIQDANDQTGIDTGSIASGDVYTFHREANGDWKRQSYIKASNADSQDLFGSSIALSADGTTLAVGARGEGSKAAGIDGDEDDNSAASSGAVYLFQSSNDKSWKQTAYVKASNAEKADFFGYAVALSDDGSVLGATAAAESSSATGFNGSQSDNSRPSAGAAYIFRRTSPTSWAQTTYIKTSTATGNAWFGTSISMSSDGSTLAVGATSQQNSPAGSGRVFIFAL